jgi:hypothetical protein
VDEYLTAQRAIADLKAAVLSLLQATDSPLTNAEIGRTLGIYMGHVGHEGHISRTILGLLQTESLVVQDENRAWTATSLTSKSDSHRGQPGTSTQLQPLVLPQPSQT